MIVLGFTKVEQLHIWGSMLSGSLVASCIGLSVALGLAPLGLGADEEIGFNEGQDVRLRGWGLWQTL